MVSDATQLDNIDDPYSPIFDRPWTPLTRPSYAADPALTARDVVKIYGRDDNQVTALDHIDVDIERGRFTAIMGPSGSGKSTLMHVLAGLDRVTSGTITLGDEEITAMNEARLTKLRRDRIGFVFQSFNLIPTLSAEENITFPSDVAHHEIDRERFDMVVDAMGLRERLSHRPAELSGGQQQRVACARALVSSPDVVFADEPTGNLDSQATKHVLERLRSAVDTFGQTVVMVTHEPDAAAYADRVLFLVDGKLVAQLDGPTPGAVLDALRDINAVAAGEEPQVHAESLPEDDYDESELTEMTLEIAMSDPNDPPRRALRKLRGEPR